MEHRPWTPERFDDLSERVDAGFARVDHEMSEGFARVDREMSERFEGVDRGFERVDRDIRDLRGELGAFRTDIERRFDTRFDKVDARFDRFEARFDAFQRMVMGFGGAVIVCLLGAILAFALGGS